MFYRDIAKLLGYYLFGFTAALGIPFILAFYYQFIADPQSHPQEHTTLSFLLTMLFCGSLGVGLRFYGKDSPGILYRREGLLTVALIWVLTPALAALPYQFSGTLTNPFQAYFEAASGLTTTGATTMAAKKFDPETGKEIPFVRTFCGVHDTTYVYYGTIDPIRDSKTGQILLEGVEAVPKALLFWRSFTQWLGGMGIIVLFVAILPLLGVGGRVLYQAEVPGPLKDSLTPRITETALQLWTIYVGLSALEVLLLYATNSEIAWLDAFCITFSNISTGGFTIRTGSIGGYNSLATEMITMAFMVIGSVNFSLYYYALKGKLYRLFDTELGIYGIILFLSCGFVTYDLIGTQMQTLGEGGPDDLYGFWDALRYGSFQVISTQSSTGFVTANYDMWPFGIQVILLLVMFVGGMSGSTAGGMKVIRHWMLFRITQYKVESLFRPENVRKFRIGDREVDTNASLLVLCYFVIIIAISVLAVLFYIQMGTGPETALGLVACMVNNVGIGFRMDGPIESCAFLSNSALVLSSILMILGRLEFFVILAVLVPAFWRKNS